MDGQQNMLDDTDSEFLTLTYVDQALDPRSEQLSNDCTHMSKYSYLINLIKIMVSV